MKFLVLGFGVASTATALAMPAVLLFLRLHSVFDVPNARSSHRLPVYRGGGVGCLLGFLAGLTAVWAAGGPAGWLGASGVIGLALVGLADDLRSMTSILRLGAQTLAGAVIGFVEGHTFFWALASIALFAVLVNAVNFMDGINGITGLTFLVWGVSALVAAMPYASSRWVALLGAVCAGTALGFLPFNAPRAIVFLGDVGSYFFGALTALAILASWLSACPTMPLIAPLLIYLCDTSTTLLRRAFRREHLLAAHREHIYQRLANDAGLSHLSVAAYIASLDAVSSTFWLLLSPVIAAACSAIVMGVYLNSPALARWLLTRRTPRSGSTPCL